MSCWTMGLNQSTHGTWNTNALMQPAPRHRRDLPAGQRPVLPDRPAQRDGRARDGLHGAGPAGAALGARRRGPAPSSRTLWGISRARCGRTSAAAPSRCSSKMAAGEIKACWVICTNPVASVANRATVIAGLEAGRARHHAGRLRRHRDQRVRRRRAAGGDVGRVRRRDGQLGAQPDPAATGGGRRPARRCRTGRSSPELLVPWDFRTASPTRAPRRCSTRSRRFANPATGYDLRGISYERLAEQPMQWPAAPGATGAQPDPLPQRRRQPEDSGTADGSRPRLAFATASRPGAVLPAAARAGRRDAGRGLSRTCSTPVALQHQWHTHDQDRQGGQAQQAQPRAVRRGASGRRHGAGHRRRRLGRGGVAARAGGAAGGRHRSGAARQLLHDRSTGTTCSASTSAINAVTNDAVDPMSFQPEFKFCAVVADPGAPRARRCPSRPRGGAIAVLADAFGLVAEPPPELTARRRRYLRGFLSGLGTRLDTVGATVPVLPDQCAVQRQPRVVGQRDAGRDVLAAARVRTAVDGSRR